MLRSMTHTLSENSNGFDVGVEDTQTSGRAKWEAAIRRSAVVCVRTPNFTAGADKGYDMARFATALERFGIKAHVTRKNSDNAVDGGIALGKTLASGPTNRDRSLL